MIWALFPGSLNRVFWVQWVLKEGRWGDIQEVEQLLSNLERYIAAIGGLVLIYPPLAYHVGPGLTVIGMNGKVLIRVTDGESLTPHYFCQIQLTLEETVQLKDVIARVLHGIRGSGSSP